MGIDLSSLNDRQRDSIMKSINKSAVVLAGAGSGKTKVLTNRIAYLLDMGIQPSEILAVTFTRKAANEIKERITELSTDDTRGLLIGTFHAICVQWLRMYGSNIGLDKFNILTPSDACKILKDAMESYNVDCSKENIKLHQSKISACKNGLEKPSKIRQRATNGKEVRFADIYELYINLCWRRKCLDFDDLISYMIALLQQSQEVSDKLNDQLKYVMIDEFQDTNKSQMLLVKLLTKNNNIFIVGDDDQSIYAFRGAKPEYIINFQNMYPNSEVFKLEQNYRSTKVIVEAGNDIVKNNVHRTSKKSFTDNKYGNPIIYHKANNQDDEASWVADEVKLLINSGVSAKDIAILYRTNATSRNFEDKFMANKIGYKVIGGIPFYERKEIKDIMSILTLFNNPKDVIAMTRCLKLYKGVGAKGVEFTIQEADTRGLDFATVFETTAPKKKDLQFAYNNISQMFEALRDRNDQNDVVGMVQCAMMMSGYYQTLQQQASNAPKGSNNEYKNRIENLEEFVLMAKQFKTTYPNADLNMFLEQILLSISGEDDKTDKVSLMTIHASKGLEFPYVFLVAFEESILPHKQSMAELESIEEERRLAYVAVTRAQEQLYFTNANTRAVFNKPIQSNSNSRFLEEVSKKYIVEV